MFIAVSYESYGWNV